MNSEAALASLIMLKWNSVLCFRLLRLGFRLVFAALAHFI